MIAHMSLQIGRTFSRRETQLSVLTLVQHPQDILQKKSCRLHMQNTRSINTHKILPSELTHPVHDEQSNSTNYITDCVNADNPLSAVE